jgi:superfamily I DNA and RNA helicase
MTELTVKQAKLAQLKNVRDSGVSALRSGDNRVDYRSMAEVNQAISALEAEIAALDGTASSRRRVRYIYQTGKGL